MLTCRELNWNDPCLQEILPSPLYSPFTISYQCAYMKDWKFYDISFSIYDTNQLIAALLLTHGTNICGEQALNFYGLPAICIQNLSLPKEAQTRLINIFRNILNNYSQYKITFKEYLVGHKKISTIGEYLLEQGANCNLQFFANIDLQLEKEMIWQKIRKRYKSLINKSLNTLEHVVVNRNNLTDEHFISFRRLHYIASGRITRNNESWLCQMNMVKQGKAFLIMTYYANKLVGASFYIIYNKRCYYGVGAYNRDLFHEIPITHGAIWKAILYAKTCRCKEFNMGDIYFPFQKDLVSAKEFSIGNFKKGFCDCVSQALILKNF